MGLSGAEVRQFVNDGYVVVRECFSREIAEAVAARILEKFAESGESSESPRRAVNVVKHSFSDGAAASLWSPTAVAALDILLGAGRYDVPNATGWPVLNFPGFASAPWTPPTGGWHVDGNHFHHHLTSREQGVVGLLLYSDIAPGGGGTAVMPGSHRVAARVLAEAEPEGLTSDEVCERVGRATEGIPVVEARGNAGDLLLMHPHLYHASSANTSGVPRVASNVCVSLKEPMNLSRANGDGYSAVELAVLIALAEKPAGA
jgi:hypothetical protein